MRRVAPLLGFVALAMAGLATLLALGGPAAVHMDLLAAQRAFQTTLAQGVRALKAGTPGAALGLAGLGFGYGVLHAIGPGHGKVVLGAWAFSSRAARWRVAAITLAASLAQATTAVVIVLAGAALFNLGRVALVDIAEGPVSRAGNLVIAALGAWLVWRGLRGAWRLTRARVQDRDHDQSHNHDHDKDEACECGHSHTPEPEAAAKAGPLEALALIGGVALRPCTGALFVMILTLRIGAPVAGVLATYAMGLGTALITLAVALSSAGLRDSIARLSLQRRALLRGFGHGAELGLGILVIALAL